MSIIHVTSCTARDRLGAHFIQYLGSQGVNQDGNNKHDEAYYSEKKKGLRQVRQLTKGPIWAKPCTKFLLALCVIRQY